MNSIRRALILLIFLSGSIFACTGFFVARDNHVYAGNNEDFNYPKTKMWIIPKQDGHYGRIFFGYDDFLPQGGMNEKGLFFDGFATEYYPVTNSGSKPTYDKLYDSFINEIMSTCSNVDEVIQFVSRYNLNFMSNAMYFFGDAEGHSIIVEGDEILKKEGDFQVVTNFYQSKKEPVTCKRFITASAMLQGMDHVTIEQCRQILDATKQESTVYSQIYDLKNLIVNIYNFHDFDHCVKIDLRKELGKGRAYYDLPGLFPANKTFDLFAEKYYGQYVKHASRTEMRDRRPGRLDRFTGDYFYSSYKEPPGKYRNDLDSTKHICIQEENGALFLFEKFGAFAKYELQQENDSSFFYITRYYRLNMRFVRAGASYNTILFNIIAFQKPEYTWEIELKRLK